MTDPIKHAVLTVLMKEAKRPSIRPPGVAEITQRITMHATAVDVGRAINDLKDEEKVEAERVEYWGWRVKG